MPVPPEVRLARHAIDLDDDGHDAVENLVTAETDTSLVVAPDGAGGVEFRAEAGSVAGHYEVIVSGTAPPVAVSTPGDDDWLYAFVAD
jgi:hypothetical protein